MALVCATNLSEPSLQAGTLAAALALRLGEPLWLLGVVDDAHPAPDAPPSAEAARERLEAEARRLKREGADVVARLEMGRLEDVLAADAELRHARLIVLACEGWSSRSPLRRAPVHERLARFTEAPILVTRREDGLLDWARGRRRLLVLAGVDLEPASDAAVAYLKELRRMGPCDVLATYVCSPVEERQRLGIHSPVHVEQLDPVVRGIETLEPQVERVLLREVRERVGVLPGEGSVEAVLEPGFGRPADHLLHVAHARRVDLMVVGTHQRSGLKRLLHGSVSAGVLRHAEQSVVCVPPTLAAEAHAQRPPRSVLVPVDFSEASARAIRQARTLVGPGGRVHLLHVHRRGALEANWDTQGVLPEPPREREGVLRRLRELVPSEDGATVQWTVEGVSGDDVAQAICQATEREGVDLVCVGAAEEARRPGSLGPVTRRLVERCRRPVMVVPAH
jgi:nucleotide-binding universal stress UspA family protein